jgi:hypothetical protein
VKLTTHLHLVSKSKIRWSYTSIPQYVLLAWRLVKHRDNFTFTFTILSYQSQGSSVSTVTRLRGQQAFDSCQGGISFPQPPGHHPVTYPNDTGGSAQLKWPKRETDHSFPCSTEVKNPWSYTFTSPIRLHGVVLSKKKAQGQLYQYLRELNVQR